MKTLNLKTLILVSLLTLPTLNAYACQGGSCGGGGSVIKGMTLDTYLKKNTANKDKLKASVASQLNALEKKLPEFAHELRRGFDDLDWYMVDVPLEQLPFSRTKTPFAIKQASIQIEDNVFTDKEEFKKLNKDEQAKHIVHELVRRIFLAAEGTNTQVTEGSVAKATNVIFDEAGNLSSLELRQQLEKLGYQTKNISYDSDKPKSREIASMRDPVAVNIDLLKPITIKSAREVSKACFSGNGALNPAKTPLLLDVLFALKGDARKYKIPVGDRIGLDGSSSFPDAEVVPTLVPEEDGYARSGVHADTPESAPNYNGSTRWDNYYATSVERRKGAIWLQETYRSEKPIEGTENPDIRFIEVKLEGSFPVLEYQGDENEPVYTKFGLTNEERHLNRISIVANRNWVEGEGLVELRHAKTGVALPMKVQGKTYIDCLRHGLEKASREPVNPDAGIDRTVISGSHAQKREVKTSTDVQVDSNGSDIINNSGTSAE